MGTAPIDKIAREIGAKVHNGHGNGASSAEPAGDQPWPEPDLTLLPPHRRQAPGLPLAPFRSWGPWISEAAEAKGAPADYVALALVVTAGSLLANSRRASPWPGWVEPPILWGAALGLPSSGKSPAIDRVLDLVRTLEHELDGDFDERQLENLVCREVAKAKREKWDAEVRVALKHNHTPPDPPREIDPPELPTRRRLFTSDATVERLARIIAANDRGILLARDELAGWLGSLDKYGGHGGDRALYLETFGGRPYVIDRQKDAASVRVPHLSVSVLGGIQPDRLDSLLLAGDDDGCAARFLYSWPEARRPTRPRRAPNDAVALGSLRWLLTLGPELADGRKVPRILPMAPGAADLIQLWREEVADMESEAAGLFLSWLGKLPGFSVRLALILELLWWCSANFPGSEPTTVGLDATEAATSLLRHYFLPMARRAFGEAALPQADRDAVTLARHIYGRNPVPALVNARELRHADALPTREADRYDQALKELDAAGWVLPAPKAPGPSRGRKDW